MHKKEVDFVIGGITITRYRNRVVDFTTHVNMEYISAIYSFKMGFRVQSDFVLKPFTWRVWVCLVSTVVTIMIFIKFECNLRNLECNSAYMASQMICIVLNSIS